jgi:hypothetical protein
MTFVGPARNQEQTNTRLTTWALGTSPLAMTGGKYVAFVAGGSSAIHLPRVFRRRGSGVRRSLDMRR